MASFNVDAMKSAAKATLLANGWESKSYDGDGNIISSGQISAQGAILVDAIADAFIIQFNIWKATQTTTGTAVVTTAPGVAPVTTILDP